MHEDCSFLDSKQEIDKQIQELKETTKQLQLSIQDTYETIYRIITEAKNSQNKSGYETEKKLVEYKKILDEIITFQKGTIEEYQKANLKQDEQINMINKKLEGFAQSYDCLEQNQTSITQQIQELNSSIQKLNHDFHNGWRTEFLKDASEMMIANTNDSFKQMQKSMSDMQNIYLKMFDSKLKTNEKIADRKVVDINKIMLYIFGSGGLLFITLEIIKQFFLK